MPIEKNEKNKFNNFLVQGSILAIAGILVRVLGLAKRIPMPYIIGDVGNAYYSAAYEVYNVAFTVSVYGIPLAVSKLVSAKVSKGEYRNADKIFKCTLRFAVILGLLVSGFVFVFADGLSKMNHEPMSYLALRVLAPALLLFCISAVFRGYFQGMGSMVQTACSQLIETIVLVPVGLGCAYYFTKYGRKVGALLQNENYANAYGAAGATLGYTVGAAFALTFMILVYKANKRTFQKRIFRDPTHVIDSSWDIYKALLVTIVPITVGSFVNNISNYLDMCLHNWMMDVKGLEAIKSVNWGIYSGKYLVLINVPIAIAASMGMSTVPTISGLMKRKEYHELNQKIESVIRLVMIIAFPCAVGLAVVAPNVVWMLFSTKTATAPNLLRIGSIGVVLFSLSTLTNGILQGMGRLIKPITHGLIAIVIHASILLSLLYFTDLNIYAVALSNNIFALAIFAMNIVSIRRVLNYRQEVKKTFVLPLLCSLAMGVIVFVLDSVLSKVLHSRFTVVLSVLVGAVVYLITMLLTKGITRYELEKFPGGSKLYKIFKRLHLCA
ncbi:MAG: polysaccharide biosynthesis protein [Lachnospiraceae bacterium]|nr:polysaccharide biosynthesis protein [Lachnospiraceae bacterium]